MKWDDDCWDERERLIEEAQVNHLYHRKRERLFASLDRWSKVLALIFGSAAATDLMATADAKALAGLIVAVASLPAIILNWSDKSRLHSELAAEYAHLEADVEGAGVIDREAIGGFTSKMIRIRAKEPPELAALLLSCQNELYVANDQPEMVVSLGWRRYFMHFLSLPVPPEKMKQVDVEHADTAKS